MKKLIPLLLFFLSINIYSQTNFKIEDALKGVVIVAGNFETRPILSFASQEKAPPPYQWIFEGYGASGFAINYQNKTFVLTNAHVIEKIKPSLENKIALITYDGNIVYAKLIGGDSFYDFSLLELSPSDYTKVKPLPFRPKNNPIKIGEDVFAIGHPLLTAGNFQFTVTKGIISGLNRTVPLSTTRLGLIQHSAQVASGNSGGPLIDANGFVIGINSLSNDMYNFINHSLDIELVISFLPEILKFGKIQRSFLGIEFIAFQNLEDEPNYFYLQKVFVNDIFPNSPLANKLLKGDKIISINNSKIQNYNSLLIELEKIKPGEKISITVERSNKTFTITETTIELNDNAYETISKFVLNKYTSLNYFVDDGIPYIAFSNKPKKRITFAAFRNDRIFPVHNFAELGKILKLASIEGSFILFTLPTDANPYDIINNQDILSAIMSIMYSEEIHRFDFNQDGDLLIY